MRLLDESLEPIGKEIDLFISSSWNLQYYNYGDFELLMPLEYYDENAAYVYNTDLKELGIINKIERNKRTIRYKGNLLLFILNKYFINKTMNYTNQTTEYIVKDLVKTFGPQDLIIEELNSRATGKIVENLQVTGENLGDYILQLLEEQELSAKIYYDYENKKMTFMVYQGADNTQTKVPLSTNNETVSDYTYYIDKSQYRNYAYVAGEDRGTDRVIVEVDARTDPDEQKFELWVDARATTSDGLTADQYKEALKQKGLEKLKKYAISEMIDISPSYSIAQSADIELGEQRIFKETFVESTQRITGLIYGYEDGVKYKSVIFGNQRLLNRFGGINKYD